MKDPRLPFEAGESLARARQFRDVATPLPDIVNGRPNWPKYSLLFHAIELALKAAIAAFEERGGKKPGLPDPGNHDLSALYAYAVAYGMVSRQEVLDALPDISVLSVTHYARYPKVPVRPVPLISQYDDLTDQIMADVRGVLAPNYGLGS